MKTNITRDQKSEVFEKTMMYGLAVFVVALTIVNFNSSDIYLTWQLWLALSCFSISLPYLIFQIACLTLGVTQRHKAPLQVATVILATVGIFASLINLSIFIGALFAISCLSAYYLFTVCSTGSKVPESIRRRTSNIRANKATKTDEKVDEEAEEDAEEKVPAMAGTSN